MQTPDLLELINGGPDANTQTDADAYIELLRTDLSSVATDPPERLVHAALRAGSQATAGIAGHQAAVRRLFPTTAADAITAFCVSEDRGPHPRYIKTALSADGEHITGSKMWGTMAPPASTLYVAASTGLDAKGNNQLAMVAIDSPQERIRQIPLPPERQAGSIPICDLEFDAVPVAQVFPGDAYNNYIKPFRLIEDVFSTLATQICLYRLGAATGLDHTQREDLLALIVQGYVVAQTHLNTSTEVLLMTSYLRSSQAHWGVLAARWHQADPVLYRDWQPGRMILTVAARAREQRRSNAWADLEASGT
ncbi:MAG: hypothetical protein AAF513_08145 [Pseudomonadota bacterium]